MAEPEFIHKQPRSRIYAFHHHRILITLLMFKYHLSHSFVKSILYSENRGFPNGSVVKNPPANIGDTDSMPGLGRSPGEGNGHPFQYSCLGNPMDREAWWATVHGFTEESDTN